MEPSSSERLDRLVRSSLHRQEAAFCAALIVRLLLDPPSIEGSPPQLPLLEA